MQHSTVLNLGNIKSTHHLPKVTGMQIWLLVLSCKGTCKVYPNHDKNERHFVNCILFCPIGFTTLRSNPI